MTTHVVVLLLLLDGDVESSVGWYYAWVSTWK